MKFIYTILISVAIILAGCVDLEETPPSLLSPESFFTTESEFQAVLVGAYRPLYSDWEGFDYAYPLIMSSGAEDVSVTADIFKNLDRLRPNGEDQSINGMWKQLYRSISNANTIIGNLENATEISDQTLGEIEGQAKFIRAFSFFHLTRWFGEVQLTTFENQTNINELKQASVADIYASIVQDLKDAEETLPVSFAERGRPTQGAAKALLAKVYLTMAGWPLEQADNFPLARDKAAELISGNLAGTYTLESNFSDLWVEANKSTNSEFIFAFYGTIAPEGTPSHLHTASRHAGNEEGGWGDFFSEKRFFDAFPAGPRKDASFTSTFADGMTFQEVGIQPFIAKYRDAGEEVNNGGEGFSVQLRYADVLLIYAEAANQAGNGPTAEALEAINKVRRRAAGFDLDTPNAAVDLSSSMSIADFDDAVLAERNWELAFENNRWFDLVRKKMVVEVNMDIHPNVTVNNRLLPKPTAQLIPGILTQNP